MRPRNEAIFSLGSRTTILHPEIKRHRAWWKEILRSRVHEKIANRVSFPAAAAKDPPSLLVDGERHAHIHLVEQVGILLSNEGKGKVFDLLSEVKAVARGRQGAGLDLENTELTALLCGYGSERGTTHLLCTLNGGDAGKGKGKARLEGHGGCEPAVSLAKALSGDEVKAMGLQVDKVVLNAGDFGSTLAREGYEIGRRSSQRQGLPEDGGGGCDEGSSNSCDGEGRVVLLCCDDIATTAGRLVAQVERARAWNERHRGCFLPIAWAVCATVAAKWPRGWLIGAPPFELNEGRQRLSLNEAAAKQGKPSPFSLLALLAAFLDRESTSRGVSTDIFGAESNPTFGQRNPNLAEIFLSFCSFVRQLGAGGVPMVTLEVLANGETVTKAEEFNIQQKEAVVASGLEHDEPKEENTLEEGTGPILLAVEGELREDLLNPTLASRLRRACRDVELSLTPDKVRGLPVWSQDIRWSLLGHALESTRAAGKESAAFGECCYLEWMELKLLMCMNEDIDALPGLYGYHVTGSLPLRPGTASPQQEWRAVVEAPMWVEADVELCRSADEAFALAIAAESAEGERKEIENSDDGDIAMSDSLYNTDEDIDGVPMSPSAQEKPREWTDAPQSCSPKALAPSAETDLGKTGSSEVMENDVKEKEVEGGVDSLSTDSAKKIGAVLAQGDKVMKAVADAVAAVKAGGEGGGTSCTNEGENGEGREIPKTGEKEEGNKDGKSKERTLAKALAKERGRERGKQREKERVAELEAAKKKEEMVKERRHRERQEMDRIRAKRQEDHLLDKAVRKLDDSKRTRLTNLRERKPERYASLAVRQRRRSGGSSSSISSSSDSSETSSRNRSSSGVEKGVSSRGLGRRSSGGGGRARGRAAERGGDLRSRGLHRSRSIESRRASKKRGSRSRSRSGWRNRGRSGHYNNNNDSGRTRGGNRNARSPSPPSDARSERDNEETNKRAEGERELPSSTVWSEWRSVSSEGSSNNDSVREKAHRSVIRSVTTSDAGVDRDGSSGLVIRLKRGSSLVRPPEVSASGTSSVATVAMEAVVMCNDGKGDGEVGSGCISSKAQIQKEGRSGSRGSGKRIDNDEDGVHCPTRGGDSALSSRSRAGKRGGGREDSRGAPFRSDSRRARSTKRGGDDNNSKRSARRSSSRDRSRGRRGEFLPSSRMDSTGSNGGNVREYHRAPAYRSRSRSGEPRRRLRRSRSRSRSIRRRSQSRHRHSHRRNKSRSRESWVGRPSSSDGKTSENDSGAALEDGMTESEEGEVLLESRGVKSTALCATGNTFDSSMAPSTGERHRELLVQSVLVDKREEGDEGSKKGTPVRGAAVTRKAVTGNAVETDDAKENSSQVEVTGKGDVGNMSSLTCEGVVEGERAVTGSASVEAEASGTVRGESAGSGSRDTTCSVLCRFITSGGVDCLDNTTMDDLANRENLVGMHVAKGEVKDAVNDKISVTVSTVGESVPKITLPPAVASINRAPILSENGQATMMQETQNRKRWDVVGSSPMGKSASVREAKVLDSLETTDGGADVIGPGGRVGDLAGTESLSLEPKEVEQGEGGGLKPGGDGAVIPVGRSPTEASCGDVEGDRVDELTGAENLDTGSGEVLCGDGGNIKFKHEDDATASSIEGAASELTPSPAAAANARAIAPPKNDQVVPARREKTGWWGMGGSPKGQGNATFEAVTVRVVDSEAVAPGLQDNTGFALGGGRDSDSVEGPGKNIALGPGEAVGGDKGDEKSASDATPPPAIAADTRATDPLKNGQVTLDRQNNSRWWGMAASSKGQGGIYSDVSTVKAVASKTGAAGSQEKLGAVLGSCDSASVEGPGGVASERLGSERVDMAHGVNKDHRAAPLSGWSSPAFASSPASPAQAIALSQGGHAGSARQHQGQGNWWIPGLAASPLGSQGAATFEGVPFGALTLGALTPAALSPGYGSPHMTSSILERVAGSGGIEGPGSGAVELAGLEGVVEDPRGVVRKAESEGKSFRVEHVADRAASATIPLSPFITAAANRVNVPRRGDQANPTQKLNRRARRGKWARSTSFQTGQGGPRGRMSSVATDPSGHEPDVLHPPRREGESATSMGVCLVIPQTGGATVSLPPQEGGGSSGSVDVVDDASNGNEETASEEGQVDEADYKAPSGSWWGSGSTVSRPPPAARKNNWFRKQRRKRAKLLQDVHDKKDPQGKV